MKIKKDTQILAHLNPATNKTRQTPFLRPPVAAVSNRCRWPFKPVQLSDNKLNALNFLDVQDLNTVMFAP